MKSLNRIHHISNIAKYKILDGTMTYEYFCDLLSQSWKAKSSSFTPDFCPILLDGDPWIVQPSEYYDEIDINGLKKKHS